MTEDFKEYPRDIDSDLKLLASEGVDVVFAPSIEEMYPNGFDTYINVGNVSMKLEGEHRLNHFDGVATIVCKLFNFFDCFIVYRFFNKHSCWCIARLS